MKSSKVAKRYARAMLGLSADHAQMEVWGGELERLSVTITAPALIGAFASPEVTPAVKLEALEKIAARLELSYPLRSFAAVVARHGRLAELPAIAEAYRRMLDERLGRTRAELIFARAPSDRELAGVVGGLEALAGKRVLPTVSVNPGLLGGVIAELEGKTYDGSLASRLAQAGRRLAS